MGPPYPFTSLLSTLSLSIFLRATKPGFSFFVCVDFVLYVFLVKDACLFLSYLI